MFRIAATLATVFAATVTLGGATAAAASSDAGHSPGHGTERFVFMGTSTRTGKFSVIATGFFTDGGTINLFSSKPEIRLGRGDLRFSDHDRPGRFKFSKATCLLTISGHGTYDLSHGTGNYRGISGRGSYITRGRAVYPRKANGTCAHSRPLAFQGVVTLIGPVTKR